MDNLTPKEAAEFLRCSTEWLQKCRQRGTGPAYVRMGHKIVYRREDLVKYVEQNVVAPEPNNSEGEHDES